MTPKITVIIPVYNTERYIEDCLHSILEQSFTDFEVLCINDGSTDNSEKIVAEMAEDDCRIKLISNEQNRGLSYARNIGIREAKGDYVIFVDSDDTIKENAIEELYNLAVCHQTDIVLSVVAGRKPYREVLEPINGTEYLKMNLLNNRFNEIVVANLYSTFFLRENNLWFEEDIFHEDNLFSFQTIISAKRLICINREFYFYRENQNSITLTQKSDCLNKRLGSMTYVIERLFAIQQRESDYTIKKCIEKYIQINSSSLLKLYRTLEYVDESMLGNKYNTAILRMITVALYRGMYPDKLSKETMKSIYKFAAIYIYGAGEKGQGLCELLEERGITISGYIVTWKPDVKDINRYPIYGIQSILERKDEVLILIANVHNYQEMEQTAVKYGFKNIIVT